MGYRVKYGENHSYKYYGNEIFTPYCQVEKFESSYSVYTSENGLADKLLLDRGSKKLQNIFWLNNIAIYKVMQKA